MQVQGIYKFFGGNYAPVRVSLELQCSALFCLYLHFYLSLLQGFFPNFCPPVPFHHFVISLSRHLIVWLFRHLCFKHALTMTQLLVLPETVVEIQRKFRSYVLDCNQITCFPLQAERNPVTTFNKKKRYPYQKQST